MCEYCCEQFIKRSEKMMLICKLKKDEPEELMRLCPFQRFCPDKNAYIPHRQKEGCRINKK